MRIVVFGATGRSGAQIVDVALERGHNVIAVARDPAKIETVHERLEVRRGDILDASSLPSVLEDADVVTSAVGPAKGRPPTTVYSVGITNLLAAMQAAKLRRLIAVTAVPVAPREQSGTFERIAIYPLLQLFFGGVYNDMRKMEAILQESDLDWTIVRPPQLTEKRAKGSYQTAINANAKGHKITRADLAAAVLDMIGDPQTFRAAVGVVN